VQKNNRQSVMPDLIRHPESSKIMDSGSTARRNDGSTRVAWFIISEFHANPESPALPASPLAGRPVLFRFITFSRGNLSSEPPSFAELSCLTEIILLGRIIPPVPIPSG
jgi:hypothetical protein